jgi:intracellular septation protein
VTLRFERPQKRQAAFSWYALRKRGARALGARRVPRQCFVWLLVKCTPSGHLVGMSALLRLLIEAGPLLAFFIANSLYGMMAATALFMGAAPLALAASWLLERRLPLMPIVGCFFVMLFGGLTLWLHNDIFIKIKPTIVNGLFAVVLFSSHLADRNALKLVFGFALDLDAAGWRALTLRWAFFFVVLAVLNEIVWRNFSNDAWARFKLFGAFPLTVVFSLAQIPLIIRHKPPDPVAGDSSDAAIAQNEHKEEGCSDQRRDNA